MENAEPAEPMLATESIDPTDPIERIDPFELIDRIEFSDRMDSNELPWADMPSSMAAQASSASWELLSVRAPQAAMRPTTTASTA